MRHWKLMREIAHNLLFGLIKWQTLGKCAVVLRVMFKFYMPISFITYTSTGSRKVIEHKISLLHIGVRALCNDSAWQQCKIEWLHRAELCISLAIAVTKLFIPPERHNDSQLCCPSKNCRPCVGRYGCVQIANIDWVECACETPSICTYSVTGRQWWSDEVGLGAENASRRTHCIARIVQIK